MDRRPDKSNICRFFGPRLAAGSSSFRVASPRSAAPLTPGSTDRSDPDCVMMKRFMLVFASLLVVHCFEPKHGPATLLRPTLPAQRRAVAVYALPESAANRGELLTLSMQSLHLAMFGGGLLQPEAMNSMVASFSDTFRSLGFTADKMFEADLAVAAFVLWIAFFESLSFVPGNERWRLDGQPALNPLRGFGRDLHKTVVPAVTYLASIAAFHHFHLGTLLFGEKPPLDSLPPPTYWRLVSEVALGVFLYDLFFTPLHVAMHQLG